MTSASQLVDDSASLILSGMACFQIFSGKTLLKSLIGLASALILLCSPFFLLGSSQSKPGDYVEKCP
jgi:hypothetical protein